MDALHASSPRSVTLPQLRFTLIVMVNFHGDLHPEGGAHAGRTKKKGAHQGERLLYGKGLGPEGWTLRRQDRLTTSSDQSTESRVLRGASRRAKRHKEEPTKDHAVHCIEGIAHD